VTALTMTVVTAAMSSVALVDVVRVMPLLGY
jgi:hypothetical protein